MATLDGNSILNANEIYSSDINFSGTLNNINPTIFNYLTGTTSNTQTQLNSISSTAVMPVFSVGTVTDLSSGATPTVSFNR